jgi:hypothetical protein
MLIAGAGTIVAHTIRREDRVQSVFNASQIMLKAGAGVAVLAAFGTGPDGKLAYDLALVGPILLASLAMFVANHLMVATMIALASGEPVLRLWYQTTREVSNAEMVEYVAQVGFGTVMAALTFSWALLLLVLPAPLAFKFLERQSERRSRIGRAAKADGRDADHQCETFDGAATRVV